MHFIKTSNEENEDLKEIQIPENINLIKEKSQKVKSAFDCDVIATNGTHFSKNLLKKLKEANEK